MTLGESWRLSVLATPKPFRSSLANTICAAKTRWICYARPVHAQSRQHQLLTPGFAIYILQDLWLQL